MKDLAGQRFGERVVVRFHSKDQHGNVRWFVRCDCGREKGVFASNLKQYLRCEHCRRGHVRRRNQTHGMSKTRPYRVWNAMWSRCTDPHSSSWENYGGRGITVCQRWRYFENFWEDMEVTYADGLTLERINVNGMYSPRNCCWADTKQQNNNSRQNVVISTPWGDMTVAQAAETSGVNAPVLYYRVRQGITNHAVLFSGTKHGRPLYKRG